MHVPPSQFNCSAHRDAAFVDCRFEGAYLHCAKLSRCDLRGSALGGLRLDDVELHGAIIAVEQAFALAVAAGLDVRVK